MSLSQLKSTTGILHESIIYLFISPQNLGYPPLLVFKKIHWILVVVHVWPHAYILWVLCTYFGPPSCANVVLNCSIVCLGRDLRFNNLYNGYWYVIMRRANHVLLWYLSDLRLRERKWLPAKERNLANIDTQYMDHWSPKYGEMEREKWLTPEVYMYFCLQQRVLLLNEACLCCMLD